MFFFKFSNKNNFLKFEKKSSIFRKIHLDDFPKFWFRKTLSVPIAVFPNYIQEYKFKRLQQAEDHFSLHAVNSNDHDEWIEDLKHNHKLSLPFRVAFGFIFAGYENFVIEMSVSDNADEWFQARDSMMNFDKVSFLSEQPEGHVPFLSTFLDTPAFASFVDEKIRMDTNADPAQTRVTRFDGLIARIRESHALVDGELELPLSELVKKEFETEMETFHASRRVMADPDGYTDVHEVHEQIETNKKPHAEFPSLYSAELLELNPHPFFAQPEQVREKTPRPPTPPADPVPLPKPDPAAMHYRFICKILKDVNSQMKRIILSRLSPDEASKLGHKLAYSHQVQVQKYLIQWCLKNINHT